MNPQNLNNYYDGDLVGFAEYLPVKPLSYRCHVHCACISGMGGTQKLSTNVERAGMEENLRHSRKASESRKEPLHKVEGGDELYEMLLELFTINK